MVPLHVSQGVNRDTCLRHLDLLVRIPSVTGDEGAAGEYLAQTLGALGLRVETPGVSPGRFNVVGVWEGDAPGPAVMLAGHLDTVGPVAGWTRDPYVPQREGDRIYGLGACDMKAGISAVVSALEALSTWGGPQRGTVLVAFVVDEEAYSEGMKGLLAAGWRADMAIMAEPHFAEPVLAAPGKVLVAGTVKGRAAHAATPEAGINAVFEASRFLCGVEKLEGMYHPLLGAHRYCVLTVRGGHEKYCIVVPDECRFTLNKHTVPDESTDVLLAQLYSLAHGMQIRAEVQLEVRPPHYPPYAGDAGRSPAPELAEAYRAVTGSHVKYGVAAGVSDANLLWGAGIPTLSFGPSGGNLHSADEWVSAMELVLAAQVYAWVLARVCGVKALGHSA